MQFLKLNVVRIGEHIVIGEKPEEAAYYIPTHTITSVQEPDSLDKRYGVQAIVTYGQGMNTLTLRVKESVDELIAALTSDEAWYG